MDHFFNSRGFSKIFKVNFENELSNLQNLIYSITKDHLEEHDNSLSIDQKLNVHFKKIPTTEFWTHVMKTVNSSKEISDVINSKSIKLAFKNIFENPEHLK